MKGFRNLSATSQDEMMSRIGRSDEPKFPEGIDYEISDAFGEFWRSGRSNDPISSKFSGSGSG